MTGLLRKFRQLLRRPEARHVGILTSGSTAAQVLLLATTPLLSRLYPPADFGVLAALMTVCTIGSSVGGLCYEVAIILPKSRLAAQSLFRLSFFLSFITAFAILAITGALQLAFPAALGAVLDGNFYIVCFFATLFSTQLNVLSYGHSRAAQFRPIAVSKFNQSLLPTFAQIVLGFMKLGASGLIIGRAIGLFGCVVWLSHGQPRGFRLRDLWPVRFLQILAAARLYRDFLIQVPRQLLVRGATMLPSVLLLAAYGAAPAGLYFFAARLVERPGLFLGDSLSRVPMKQFSDRRQRGAPLTRASLLYTLAVGAPVVVCALLLAVLAHPLFAFVFGERWEPAAGYAVVLAGWAAIRLASLPMATLTTVLRIQRLSFYLDALFAARVLIIPLMAAQGAGAIAAVAGFCALSVVYHLSTFALGLVSAMRYDRGLKRMRETATATEAGFAYGHYRDAA